MAGDIPPDFQTHPLTPDRWDDLVTVFGGGDGAGDCGRCWCMWWRRPRTGGPGMGDRRELKADFEALVRKGPPPGLVGYADGVPVAWVQVGPRPDIPEWNRPGRLTAPLDPSDAEDASVWGTSCFVTRARHRQRGYLRPLIDASIAHARAHNARCLDACPVETQGKTAATALYHGVAQAFVERGFVELARRKSDRPLLRLEL